MRETSRELSPSKGVQKCGRVRLFLSTPAIHRGPEGRAYYGGLFRCGSVWECPVCMQGIAMGRGEELRTLLDRHRTAGGYDYLLTLTLPHDQGDRLKPLRERVARAWQYVISGKSWRLQVKAIALVGFVRGHEVTVGPSGWHPHLHVVLLTGRKLSAAERARLADFLYGRWVKGINRRKPGEPEYRVPSREHGVDLQECRVSDYISKFGLGDELSKSSFKVARAGHRTPLQLLADLTRLNTATIRDEAAIRADMALWMEYVRAMRGARQLTWSHDYAAPRINGKLRALRDRYALPEQTDLALVEAAEPATPETIVIAFDNEDWDKVISRNVVMRLRFLRWVEDHDDDTARELIVQAIDKAKGLAEVPF